MYVLMQYSLLSLNVWEIITINQMQVLQAAVNSLLSQLVMVEGLR